MVESFKDCIKLMKEFKEKFKYLRKTFENEELDFKQINEIGALKRYLDWMENFIFNKPMRKKT